MLFRSGNYFNESFGLVDFIGIDFLWGVELVD
jgi:hypothetical protein